MPDVKTATRFAPSENVFVSPFTDLTPTAFYSSIIIPRAPNQDCLDCAVQNLNRRELREFLEQMANNPNPLASPLKSSISDNVIPTPPINNGSLLVPIDLCGQPNTQAFIDFYGFPKTSSGSLPYSLPGSSLASSTVFGDITTNGTSFGRSGSGNLGPPFDYDNAVIFFPVVRRDFCLTYDYYITAGGKHSAMVAMDGTVNAPFLQIGSWSDNFSNTIPQLSVRSNQTNECVSEYPIPELAGLLPQASGQWRTRRIVKDNDLLIYQDGSADVFFTKVYLPITGRLGMTLGPGVRIKNLTITESPI